MDKAYLRIKSLLRRSGAEFLRLQVVDLQYGK